MSKQIQKDDLYLYSLILEGRVKDALYEIRKAYFQTGGYQYISSSLGAVIDLATAMKEAAEK